MAVDPTKIQAQGIDLATTVTADTDNSLTTDSSGLLKSSTTSTVSSGGTTPITNGGVYTALGGRTAIVTDATPTSGSSNLMTSGGIYTALQSAGGGGAGSNIYYATCATSASATAKVATTVSNDFELVTGAMVRVLMTNANTYNGTATLNVDNTGAKNITRVGTTTTTRYFWTAGEVVDFVYDGTQFVMSNKGVATTTYYGETKLSDSTSSTSTTLAATANAVKTAYDLAASKGTGSITGVSANGTSVATSGVANIPAASTSAYGVTELSSSTSSTSTTLAATPSAVKAAYDLAASKQSALTFDSTPTSGSTNPVTSNGIYREHG